MLYAPGKTWEGLIWINLRPGKQIMSDVRPDPAPPTEPAGAQNLLSRFWTFDTLLGGSIITILYYLGLAGIALYVLFGIVAALGMGQYSAGGGLAGLILVLVFGVIGVVFWRVTCELWLIIFRIYDRLGEIRDRLPPR